MYKKINIEYRNDNFELPKEHTGGAEDEALARAIAASMEDTGGQEQPVDDELARALAASMEDATEGDNGGGADADDGEDTDDDTDDDAELARALQMSEEGYDEGNGDAEVANADGDAAVANADDDAEMVRALQMSLSGDGGVPLEMHKPYVLFLRLHASADHNGALHEQADLIKYIQDTCPQYQVDQRVFSSLDELIDIILDPKYKVIAFLSILTHGEPQSITIGNGQGLYIGTEAFRFFCKTIGSKLLPNAKVLLCACLTGFIEGISGEDDRQAALQERIITNGDHENFANHMSREIPGHQVLCTSFPQVAGELSLMAVNPPGRAVCSPANPDPLYIRVLSQHQLMYIYINH